MLPKCSPPVTILYVTYGILQLFYVYIVISSRGSPRLFFSPLIVVKLLIYTDIYGTEEMQMNIGEIVKKARLRKKLRLKDVAEATNLSISYISDIEHGRSTPPVDTLQSLCNVLDVSIYSFFTADENMVLMEKKTSEELYALIKDFEEWDDKDKEELLSYLRVKKTSRDAKK